MTDFDRFAVYAVPRPGALADFAAAWLGWDVESGTTRAHPALPGSVHDVAALTERPRRYGFHATLKPPFRLAEGTDAETLSRDVAALAGRHAPVTIERLALRRLGGFLALVPEGGTAAIAGLAAAAVRDLDIHRAPPLARDLDRHRAPGLTRSQERNLVAWGYPYVLEDFRFHFTLTGAIDPETAEAVRRALAPLLMPRVPEPFVVRDLCLLGEDRLGRFHLLARHPLGG